MRIWDSINAPERRAESAPVTPSAARKAIAAIPGAGEAPCGYMRQLYAHAESELAAAGRRETALSAHDTARNAVASAVEAAYSHGHYGVEYALTGLHAQFMDIVESRPDAGRAARASAEWDGIISWAWGLCEGKPAGAAWLEPADGGCPHCAVYAGGFKPANRDVKPSPWYDFTALIKGERTRPEPGYGVRADDVALVYPGREHSIYGETESGKDMFLVAIVKWCLENDVSVAWIDFEEGDEIEIGSRLLNAGLEPELLNNRELFRYATPATRGQAEQCRKWAIASRVGIVIFDGVNAAYGLYEWPVKENDSATVFRARLIRPCLAVGSAAIATDHVAKDAKSQRYAFGGVMKLNMVNGASFLLEAVSPISRGGEGASRVILTKDRPSGIKPYCVPGTIPGTWYAGMLTVKSSGDGPGELKISIIPPQPGEHAGGTNEDLIDVPSEVMERVSRLYEEALPGHLSRTAVRTAAKGKKARAVPLATEKLLNGGYLEEVMDVKQPRGTHPLRSVRPWRKGVDDKIILHNNSRNGVGTES